MTEKMLTREEFEQLRRDSAAELAADSNLQRDALDVLARADQHRWVHQTTWFGEPALQIPHDLFAFQEILFATKPSFFIETGVCWGGSLLFYATLFEVMGKGHVIGVDVYLPPELKARITQHEKLAKHITLIEGSSLSEETLSQIKALVGNAKDVSVHLDSHHSHEHVLAELHAYSPLVGKGHYLVCGDTLVEKIPEQTHRPRPWGPGNNPMTALNAFLAETNAFEKDRRLMQKLLFSCNPEGYLRRVKE